LTEEQEKIEIEKFENERLMNGLSMKSNLDTSPYSLWTVFAGSVFGKK